jgi:GMP synthase (glutamine-hydrolysing)
MSHGDRVTAAARRFRGRRHLAQRRALCGHRRRLSASFYAVQFHPEVVHTPDGAKLLSNFVHKIAACRRLDHGRLQGRGRHCRIREQVGDGRVICGLSGGVDSSVAAVLIHEAIGDQLTCILVDHGLMRKNEPSRS